MTSCLPANSENKPAMNQEQILGQLTALGVPRGSVLLVHTAFSEVKPVVGGPRGLIDAMLNHLGDEGTLVMPSMTDSDDEVFDPAHTDCLGMGVVADTFWRMRGVQRSDSPHAFAAMGRYAAQMVAPHPVEIPHGPDSPVGRVHTLGGYVLLLGVNHDANTTIHLAETMAGVTYCVRKHSLVMNNGSPRRVDYLEAVHCCEGFLRLNEPLLAGGHQKSGYVGHASARLIPAREVVAAAAGLLSADETAFLHPLGECAECDLARSGMQLRVTHR